MNNKLTEKETHRMFSLIKRYAETEMDQWDLWKFDSKRGKVYLSLSLKANGPESAYFDISDKLK